MHASPIVTTLDIATDLSRRIGAHVISLTIEADHIVIHASGTEREIAGIAALFGAQRNESAVEYEYIPRAWLGTYRSVPVTLHATTTAQAVSA